MENTVSGFIASKLTFPVRRKLMFPPCSDRAAWKKIVSDVRISDMTSAIRQRADKVKRTPMPELKASEFALFRQNGNRSIYEKPYFEIRHNLEMLVLAECMEGKGEYIPRIVDYIWAICSEPCWVLPAHTWDNDDALPSVGYIRNDLFATQTGLLLALTLDLMESELAAFSQHLVDRVRTNIIDRLIVKLEKGPGEGWHDGHSNWTAWCANNLLGAAVTVLIDDPARQEKIIRQLTEYIDLYYKKFSDDGACDEGPAYWGHSPVEFCRFIEQAISAGILSTDIYKDEKLRAMIQYISDVHLGNGMFFTYSDCPRFIGVLPCGLLELLAGRLEDESIAIFAKQAFHNFKGEKKRKKYVAATHSALMGNLLDLFYVPGKKWHDVLDNTKFYHSRGYLAGRCGKLGFGVKGGTNHEGHNQNDVGHFVIARNGKFAICDPGSGTYSRQYFAADTRYDHLVCNASGHNMPLFDGVGEISGADKEPQSIEFRDENGIISYEIEMAGTYSGELELESVKRAFTFDRAKKQFCITDSWNCGRDYRVSCRFFSEIEPEKISDRKIKLGKLTFSVDNGVLTCREFEITDAAVKKSWGRLWSIELDHNEPGKSGNHTIIIDETK